MEKAPFRQLNTTGEKEGAKSWKAALVGKTTQVHDKANIKVNRLRGYKRQTVEFERDQIWKATKFYQV